MTITTCIGPILFFYFLFFLKIQVLDLQQK